MSGFNLMYEFHRIALRRNQVKPAARNHQFRGQSQHAVGDGIAMMVVIEEPGVGVALAQRGLNGGEIHGQTSIVNKGEEFRRICADERSSTATPSTRDARHLFHLGGSLYSD